MDLIPLSPKYYDHIGKPKCYRKSISLKKCMMCVRSSYALTCGSAHFIKPELPVRNLWRTCCVGVGAQQPIL